MYYKDSNYYCSLCIREKNIKDYLNLDLITLSNKEIDDFKKKIKDSEILMNKIKEINEKYIQNLLESYDKFEKRNKLLIEYCKGLIKFNEKYEKNYNLISTIRRISINFNFDEFKTKTKEDLINFYYNKNIFKFNNEFIYKYNKENNEYKSFFESEKIVKNGEYYLGELISRGGFGYVYKALSIKDKKIVAIKKLQIINNDKEYLPEVNLKKF